MAAPRNGKYFQYVNPGATGSRQPGEVFNIRDGQLPAALGVLTDEDGTPSVQLRMYDESGRYIYYRSCGTAGTFNGEQMWAYYFQYNPASVNSVREIRRISGSASKGTISIFWMDKETEQIAWVGLTAAKLQALMEKHPSIGPGNISVTYIPAGSHASGKDTYRFEWVGKLAHLAMPAGFGVRNRTTGNLVLQAFAPQNGTSDFPGPQGRYFWDLVGYQGGEFSGGVGNRADATSSARAELWTDYPAGLSGMSPADNAVVTSPRPSINWTLQSGTIGGIPITDHTIEYFEVVTGSRDDVPSISYTKSGANVNSFLQFNHLANTQLPDNKTFVRVHTLKKRSGIVSTLEYDLTVDWARPAAPPAPVWAVQADNMWITCNHAASLLPDNDFIEYVYKWRPVGTAEESDANREFMTVSRKASTFERLYYLPKNKDIIVSFYTRQYAFGVPVLSLPREFTTRLDIHSAAVINTRTREYVKLDAHLGLDLEYNEEPVLQRSWSRRAPVAIYGHAASRKVSVTWKPIGDVPAQQAEWERLERLYLNERQDTLVYSDATGENPFDCVVGRIRKFVPGGGQAFQIDVPIYEVGNRESMTAA